MPEDKPLIASLDRSDIPHESALYISSFQINVDLGFPDILDI
jgi:hypothetical protein